MSQKINLYFSNFIVQLVLWTRMAVMQTIVFLLCSAERELVLHVCSTLIPQHVTNKGINCNVIIPAACLCSLEINILMQCIIALHNEINQKTGEECACFDNYLQFGNSGVFGGSFSLLTAVTEDLYINGNRQVVVVLLWPRTQVA